MNKKPSYEDLEQTVRGLEEKSLKDERTIEKLQESEEIFKCFMEHSPIYVFFKDENIRSVRLSKNYEKMLEKPIGQLLGKSMYELFPSDLAKTMVADDMQILKEEKESTVEEELNGRFYSTIKFPINLKSKLTYLAGFTTDITERKQAEEELQRTLKSLRKSFGAIVRVMVSAIEMRDPYTAGHQIRTTNIARAIATEMELPKDRIDSIRMAGPIHDIGKLSIPAEILSKPGKLSDIEFSMIKQHAQKGYEILKDVESPWPLAEIIYQHHERMDGSGYPRNLKENEILIEARIMAVADVVESMASHRPYRASLGINAALEEIQKNKKKLYDVNVVDICLRLFWEKGFQIEGHDFKRLPSP